MVETVGYYLMIPTRLLKVFTNSTDFVFMYVCCDYIKFRLLFIVTLILYKKRLAYVLKESEIEP